MCAKRNALGKGLTALLSDSQTDITGEEAVPVNTISEIPINQIEANPFQPRENINDDDLGDLVESIKIHGVIQPLTVRKIGYDKYQIISGERRARAAIKAELHKVPAFVRVANDQNMLEMALIENTHRENLNAVEIALSYKRLIDECGLSQEDLADRVSKNRATVANYLRLLKLPDEIQIGIAEDEITMGHARAIINLDDPDFQLYVYQQIKEKSLSVRQVEELVKQKKEALKPESKQKKEKANPYKQWEQTFASLYDTQVKIKPKRNGKGELVIPFQSEEELERLSELLNNNKSQG